MNNTAFLRKNINKAEAQARERLANILEMKGKMLVALELLPQGLLEAVNPYFTDVLRLFPLGRSMDGVKQTRAGLRVAFGSWSDEVVYVSPNNDEDTADVTYAGEHNGLPVKFVVTFTVPELYEYGILSEGCRIEEQVTPESRYLSVVCK